MLIMFFEKMFTFVIKLCLIFSLRVNNTRLAIEKYPKLKNDSTNFCAKIPCPARSVAIFSHFRFLLLQNEDCEILNKEAEMAENRDCARARTRHGIFVRNLVFSFFTTFSKLSE